MGLTDNQLVQTWTGVFENTNIWGRVDLFKSRDWVGASVGVGPGAGVSMTMTDYSREPFPATVQAIEAFILRQLTTLGRSGRKTIENTKSRIVEEIERSKNTFRRFLFPTWK